MRPGPAGRGRSGRGRHTWRAIVATLAALLDASATGIAQPPLILPRPFGTTEPERAPAAPPPPVIAVVEGRPITQADYDRVANPYLAQLRASMGSSLTADIQRTAAYNVMDELIKREILVLEARKRGIQVTEAETDSILRLDPSFRVQGVFDSTRFNQFKRSPLSNYEQMVPLLRDVAASSKLDQVLRRQFRPTRAAVRAEWARLNDQVRYRYLALGWRDQSLEPEASEAEWRDYHRTHPEEFERGASARFRYFSLPLPAAGDSGRAAAEAEAMRLGRAMADSLRAGTLSDSLPGMLDTGPFDLPPAAIPGLQGPEELLGALARADSAGVPRVLGPYLATDAVIVGAIVERNPKRRLAMSEALPEVKRSADREKRRTTSEQERRDFYTQNLDRYRGTRAVVKRRSWDESSLAPRTPGEPEVERWYRQHGARLFGRSDTSRAWLPPLTDSLRARARAELEREDRAARIADAAGLLAAGFGERGGRVAAPRDRAVADETLAFAPGEVSDTLFSPPLVDSLLARAYEQRGVVQGPRRFRGTWAAWRVESADSTYVPEFTRVRARVERDFMEQRRARDDEAGRAYFEARRAQYLSPARYVIDFVTVPIPPVDSVRIPEAELLREYERNQASYRLPEQVRPRIMFFSTRGMSGAAEARVRARADSVLALVRAGEDFATLARSLSESPGSAGAGGDLGWRSREQYTREVMDAAFALQPGELAPLVRGAIGYHIVKLEERRAARARPFAEVRNEIRNRLAAARADTLARRSAVALRRELAAAMSPATVARARGGLQTSIPLAANEAIPVVGPVRGWSDEAARLAPRQWARQPFRGAARYVVFRLNRTVPPGQAEFAEVRDRAVADTNDARRRRMFAEKVDSLRRALAAGASLDSIAAPYGGLKDSGTIPVRLGFVPGLGFEPRLGQAAAALVPGAQTDTVQYSAGVSWVRLESKQAGDESTFATAAPRLTEQLLQTRYQEWVESRKRGLRIEVRRADLRRPR